MQYAVANKRTISFFIVNTRIHQTIYKVTNPHLKWGITLTSPGYRYILHFGRSVERTVDSTVSITYSLYWATIIFCIFDVMLV